jgi:predicted dehydrogenase
MNNFVDAILGRAECLNPAEDGVEIMRILDAIYRSAESGHEEVIVR